MMFQFQTDRNTGMMVMVIAAEDRDDLDLMGWYFPWFRAGELVSVPLPSPTEPGYHE